MTKAAREKLEEAQYFLRQMRHTKADPEFQYNMSAFLSAARSVTFYLQKQYRDTDGFEGWYEEKQAEMKESDLFDAMRIARNYAVKEEYPKVTELSLSMSGEDEIESLSFRGFGLGSHEAVQNMSDEVAFQSGDVEIKSIDIFSDFLNDEYQRTPFCELCEEYLEEIDALLTEWETKVQ